MKATSNDSNSKNFFTMLKLLIQIKNDLVLPVAKIATDLSPKIQNEIINIIGHDTYNIHQKKLISSTENKFLIFIWNTNFIKWKKKTNIHPKKKTNFFK